MREHSSRTASSTPSAVAAVMAGLMALATPQAARGQALDMESLSIVERELVEHYVSERAVAVGALDSLFEEPVSPAEYGFDWQAACAAWDTTHAEISAGLAATTLEGAAPPRRIERWLKAQHSGVSALCEHGGALIDAFYGARLIEVRLKNATASAKVTYQTLYLDATDLVFAILQVEEEVDRWLPDIIAKMERGDRYTEEDEYLIEDAQQAVDRLREELSFSATLDLVVLGRAAAHQSFLDWALDERKAIGEDLELNPASIQVGSGEYEYYQGWVEIYQEVVKAVDPAFEAYEKAIEPFHPQRFYPHLSVSKEAGYSFTLVAPVAAAAIARAAPIVRKARELLKDQQLREG